VLTQLALLGRPERGNLPALCALKAAAQRGENARAAVLEDHAMHVVRPRRRREAEVCGYWA